MDTNQSTPPTDSHLLVGLIKSIDLIGRWGIALGGGALVLMVLNQFVVVVLRYTFGYGLIWTQESIQYLHSIAFVTAAGYTLSVDGHVRVDAIYQSLPQNSRAWINLLGVGLLLWPATMIMVGFSIAYVSNSWSIFEGSREASGIPAVFLLKTLILVLAGLLALHGLALFLRSWLVIRKKTEHLEFAQRISNNLNG